MRVGAIDRTASGKLPAARQLDRRRSRGNPHVTADSLRLAIGRAAQALLAGYLDELNALGAELSVSSELAGVSAT